MKIELELPDWKEDEYKDWFIISGSEQRAYYRHYEKKWHIKTTRCVQCGNCCVNLPGGQYELDPETKDCIHLDKSDLSGKVRPCKLGIMRPWPCIEGDPAQGGYAKKVSCSIKYDEEK